MKTGVYSHPKSAIATIGTEPYQRDVSQHGNQYREECGIYQKDFVKPTQPQSQNCAQC